MKYYFFAILINIGLSIQAQDQKGTVLFGGNFNYNNSTNKNSFSDKEDESNLIINPEIGFYLSKNVVLGFGGGLQKINNYRVLNGSNSRFEANLKFINFYLNFQSPIRERLKFNVSTNLKRGWGESKYSNQGNSGLKGDIKEIEFKFQPGLMYFVNNRFAITVAYSSLLYYSGTEEIDRNPTGTKDIFKNKYEEVGINLGLNTFKFGFVFVFPSKGKD